MPSRSRIVATGSVLCAVGLLLGYIESFIVIPVRIPGIRIGIANIITVMTVFCFGPAFSVTVLFLRVSLSALLFGSPVSFVYSLLGGMSALAVMYLFKKLGFTVFGVSVAGATAHNIAQLLAAMVLIGSRYILYYIPALTLAGVVAGIITGGIARVVISRLDVYFDHKESRESI